MRHVAASWYLGTLRKKKKEKRRRRSWVEHILGGIAKDGTWNVGI